jgi:hypothetical protein
VLGSECLTWARGHNLQCTMLYTNALAPVVKLMWQKCLISAAKKERNRGATDERERECRRRYADGGLGVVVISRALVLLLSCTRPCVFAHIHSLALNVMYELSICMQSPKDKLFFGAAFKKDRLETMQKI